MKSFLFWVCSLFLVAGLVNCEPVVPEKTTYTVQGTVRNVWCHSGFCDIVFEHETGEMSTITTHTGPPVWTGEHCVIVLEKQCPHCPIDKVVSSRRLP